MVVCGFIQISHIKMTLGGDCLLVMDGVNRYLNVGIPKSSGKMKNQEN